jgi:hypothetical protein
MLCLCTPFPEIHIAVHNMRTQHEKEKDLEEFKGWQELEQVR